MKRAALKEIRAFARASGQPITEVEGATHTRAEVGHRRTVVARHREINELTVKAIRRQLGMPTAQVRKRKKNQP